MESNKCKDLQDDNSNEPIKTSFHHLFGETIKAVDGTLPKCDKAGTDTLINPDIDPDQYEYGNMSHQVSERGMQNI